MKRFLSALAFILFLMASPIPAYATFGTMTDEIISICPYLNVMHITCTASGSGKFQPHTTALSVNGRITKFEIVRGTTAPATTMDITLTSARNVQLMAWTDIIANRKDKPIPDSDGSIYANEDFFGPITVNVQQMSNGNSIVHIYIYYER